MPQAVLRAHGDVGELVLAAPPLNLFERRDVRRPRGGDRGRALEAQPRALIVRAEGDVFTAGVDVHVFDGLDVRRAPTSSPRGCWRSPTRSRTCRSRRSPSRTGCASPPALELSLACDLLWAAEGAQFGLVETVVGITPLMGGTQRMAERAGTARAREFVMTGGAVRRRDAARRGAW